MRLLLVTLALLFTAEAALAGTDAPVARTFSVAEMLQRKQEHQLREQLAKEGRWDEIRQMDEEQVRQQQVHTKQTLTRMNAELAREGAVDSPVNGDGVYSFCAPGSAPVKPYMTRIKPESISGGTDSSNVR